MRRNIFKTIIMGAVSLLLLVGCTNTTSKDSKKDNEDINYKYVPTIIIDIDDGVGFPFGLDYQIDVRINPSMIEYDVFYYKTSLGENSKTKTKPTEVGEYSISVETKPNGEYAPNKASKTFSIVNKKIDVSIEKIILGGQEFEVGADDVRLEYGTKLNPEVKTKPIEAKDAFTFKYINKSTSLEIDPSQMKINVEYVVFCFIQNHPVFNDTLMYHLTFKLLDKDVPGPTQEKIEITKIVTQIANKRFDMGTYGDYNKFEIGTDVTPTFITTPAQAANDIEYIMIINDETYREVTQDELVTNVEYSIHISIKKDSIYFYSGTIWVNFSLYNKGEGVQEHEQEDIDTKPQDLASIFRKVDQVWGYGNNGVASKNVTINGTSASMIATDSNKQGAALCSKEQYGEGIFEVTMRTTAASGVCTAFWTYYYENGNNYEIDIELHHNDDVMFSTWLTETKYFTSRQKTPYNIPDNEYHTYRFEWKSGTYVRYFIDGVFYHEFTSRVPNHRMNIWIGMWYPDKWAGEPIGKTNTLDIKDFSYTPF